VVVATGQRGVGVAGVALPGCRARPVVGGHALAGEQCGQVRRREAPPDVERAELRVPGTGGVEAHLVEQFLDVGEVVGEQRHAPLVVVHADAAGYYLCDPPGELPADLAVAGHQLGALLEGEVVPVVLRAAALVHRVETDVLDVRDVGFEAGLDVAGHPGVFGLSFSEVLAGHVPGDLRHGDVGVGPLGVAGELGAFEGALEVVEVRERRPEVHHEQVGLVAGDREHRRPALLGVREVDAVGQIGDSLIECALSLAVGRIAPRAPVHGPEVVEDVPSLLRGRRFASFRIHGRPCIGATKGLVLLGPWSRRLSAGGGDPENHPYAVASRTGGHAPGRRDAPTPRTRGGGPRGVRGRGGRRGRGLPARRTGDVPRGGRVAGGVGRVGRRHRTDRGGVGNRRGPRTALALRLLLGRLRRARGLSRPRTPRGLEGARPASRPRRLEGSVVDQRLAHRTGTDRL